MKKKTDKDKPAPAASPRPAGSLRDFFIGVGVGVFLTAFCGWYFALGRELPGVKRTWDQLDAKLTVWHLRAGDIQQELARTGRVVRRQVREWSAQVADSAGDAAITARIKTRLAVDRELSATGIAVNTTDGRVTLAGSVASPSQISRAMLIALETEGVREVVSTIQIKPR